MPFDPVHSDYVSKMASKAKVFVGMFADISGFRSVSFLYGLPAALTADDFAGSNANVSAEDIANAESFYAAIAAHAAANPAQMGSMAKLAKAAS